MQFSKWFKTGVYSKQLTLIAVCVGIICLGQISSCINNGFDKAYGAKPTVLIKSMQAQTVSDVQNVEENGIKFQGPDGRTIIIPKEMRGEEELVGFYRDSVLRIYVDDNPISHIREDYRIRLTDDFIEIWDIKQNRLVGTLTYKTSLGRLVMRDNE